MDTKAVDIPNRCLVGIDNGLVRILQPMRTMTKEHAAVHAAWLVCLSGISDEDFLAILRRVENT